MLNILTWKYWFTVNPGPASDTKINGLVLILGLLLITAILSLLFKKKAGIYKGLVKRAYNFCSANFIIGLVILFFVYENVPFFSSRMWMGIWFIEMAVWLFFILKKVRQIPKKIKSLEAERELKKYLP